MLEKVPAGEDPQELAYRLGGLLREYPGEAGRVRRILDEAFASLAQGARVPPEAVAVPDIVGSEPVRVLGAVGQSGMVLAEGYVSVLAAEGGIGKSSLVGTVALETAMGTDGEAFGIFAGASGPVLVVTYEDAAVVCKSRLEGLANATDTRRGGTAAKDALREVFVMDMEGWPLFGPGEMAQYNTRPVPLQGWEVLWREVERLQPKLIVIDPVLKGYVGEANGVSPVREFLGMLRYRVSEVCRGGCGILVTAHSTKAARNVRAKGQDAFDVGHVSGSAAWVDEPRGVLTMTWGEDGRRNLSVVKANLGPSRISVGLDAVVRDDGLVLGFTGSGAWYRPDRVGREDEGVEARVRNGNKNGRQERFTSMRAGRS